MRNWGFLHNEHCHWCGKAFYPKKPTQTHTFCCNACKMAHHRAYKNYVTQKTRQLERGPREKVTHNDRKKTA